MAECAKKLKKRPREAAGLSCEVEGCEVTECSNWYAQGRCCSKRDCKDKMGVKGTRGAADGVRKPRKKKPLLDSTNAPQKMSESAALAWQEAGRRREHSPPPAMIGGCMLAEYASDWIWVIARALTTHELSMRTDARAPRWEWLGLDWLSEVVRRIGRA